MERRAWRSSQGTRAPDSHSKDVRVVATMAPHPSDAPGTGSFSPGGAPQSLLLQILGFLGLSQLSNSHAYLCLLGTCPPLTSSHSTNTQVLPALRWEQRLSRSQGPTWPRSGLRPSMEWVLRGALANWMHGGWGGCLCMFHEGSTQGGARCGRPG